MGVGATGGNTADATDSPAESPEAGACPPGTAVGAGVCGYIENPSGEEEAVTRAILRPREHSARAEGQQTPRDAVIFLGELSSKDQS